MSSRKNPFINARYLLEIDGIAQAGFSEVTIPDTTTEPIDYREGNERPIVRKLAGLTKLANIVLKWGITNSLDLYNWYKDVVDGKIESSRKNISILLLDELGRESARWDFTLCWPTKYDAPDLNATANQIAIETMEIVHEGISRVK